MFFRIEFFSNLFLSFETFLNLFNFFNFFLNFLNLFKISQPSESRYTMSITVARVPRTYADDGQRVVGTQCGA